MNIPNGPNTPLNKFVTTAGVTVPLAVLALSMTITPLATLFAR